MTPTNLARSAEKGYNRSHTVFPERHRGGSGPGLHYLRRQQRPSSMRACRVRSGIEVHPSSHFPFPSIGLSSPTPVFNRNREAEWGL